MVTEPGYLVQTMLPSRLFDLSKTPNGFEE